MIQTPFIKEKLSIKKVEKMFDRDEKKIIEIPIDVDIYNRIEEYLKENSMCWHCFLAWTLSQSDQVFQENTSA